MGFFSHQCPKCKDSARSKWAKNRKAWQGQVTVVLPDRIVQGEYNGYGRVETVDGESFEIMSLAAEGGNYDKIVKMYHTKCWEEAGKPSYEEAEYAPNAPDQGFFF